MIRETTTKPGPEDKVEPKPKATGEQPSDLSAQIVNRVHKLYEELGRENVRVVEDWEKGQRDTRKDGAPTEPKPEVKTTLEPEVTTKSKPETIIVAGPEITAKTKPEITTAAGPEATAKTKSDATVDTKKTMFQKYRTWLIPVIVLLILAVLGISAWMFFGKEDKNKVLVSGNGRIEAVEIGVAAKTAGRVMDILVREGALVAAGQVVALMDTEVLEAQHRQAEAQLKQSQSNVETTRSQLVQRGSEKEAVLALVRQREAELGVARKRAIRSFTLASEAATSQQEADDDKARVQSAVAAVSAARAQLAAAGATIVTASAEIAGAKSAVEAAQATVERIQADIKDSALKSPREGRVQYRVAQPGEVVSAGGRVLSMVDLSDVYMTFFLPTEAVGRVALGTEVRLVLDAASRYVIPAKVSFVSDVAQFTPKTVETASERQKLMFRVRAQISPDLLRKHLAQVKTGLPGVAYIRQDPAARGRPVSDW